MINNNLTLIENIACRFKDYKNNRINKDAICCYINQIEKLNINKEQKDEAKKGFLNLLSNIIYYNSDRLSHEISLLVSKIQKSFPNGTVISYGKENDSNKIILNYFDCNSQNIAVNDIHTALDSNNSLIFLDDAINSGNQIISIFQEYMGVEANKRKTREHHVEELSMREKKLLCKSKIIIGIMYYNESVEKFIKREFKQLGISDVNIVYNYLFNKRINDNNSLFDNENQKEITINLLERIGVSLLNSNKTHGNAYKFDWTKKRVRKSALGYHNAQQLIVFEYNISTYNAVALWDSGIVDGIEWKSLFIRRD